METFLVAFKDWFIQIGELVWTNVFGIEVFDVKLWVYFLAMTIFGIAFKVVVATVVPRFEFKEHVGDRK